MGRALRTENCPLQERKKVRAEGKLGCPAVASANPKGSPGEKEMPLLNGIELEQGS